MGLLDGKPLSPFLNMKCDVYYASDTQDKFGAMVKTWTMDRSVDCELYMIDRIADRNNFTFDDPQFFRLNNLVRGRSLEDIRIATDGTYYSLSHVVITNVRLNGDSAATIYVMTDGDGSVKPIVYALSTYDPFVGPFGTTEFYKMSGKYADDQGILG